MRKEPKSQVVISVCKDLNSESNNIVHLNASIYDIDWIIEQLQREKEILLEFRKTGKMPEYTYNKYIGE